MLNKNKVSRRVLATVLFFLYVVLGYGVLMYIVDPQSFFASIHKELWIIPIALILSIIQFVRYK